MSANIKTGGCVFTLMVAFASSVVTIVSSTTIANANTLFRQQTGQPCSTCHVSGREAEGINSLNPTGRGYMDCGYKFCAPPPPVAPPMAAPQQPVYPPPQQQPVYPPPPPMQYPAPAPVQQARPAPADEPFETMVLGHNGSTIEMRTRGNNTVEMRYAGVRPGLSVRDGTVLFHGMTDRRGTLRGTAYIFRQGCPPASYSVAGVQTHDRIVLRGAAPVHGQGSCEVIGYDANSRNATLEFTIGE